MPAHPSAASKRAVHIICECSDAIGFGHLKRSATLARKLQNQVPVTVEILGDTRGCDSTLLQRELQELTWRRTESPSFADAQISILDVSHGTQPLLISHYPDQIGCSIAMDWVEAHVIPRCAINLLEPTDALKSAFAARRNDSLLFKGSRYAILRDEILALRHRADHSHRPPNVLLSFGGADPAHRTAAALRALQSAPCQLGELQIVFGPLFTRSRMRQLVQHLPNDAICLQDPPDFAQRLADADVVLCNGGGTLLEALCLGKATVVSPQTEAERLHTLEHVNAGACTLMEQLMQVLCDSGYRQGLSNRASLQVDGKGVDRIVDIILRMAI